jgi:hypothetical protein
VFLTNFNCFKDSPLLLEDFDNVFSHFTFVDPVDPDKNKSFVNRRRFRNYSGRRVSLAANKSSRRKTSASEDFYIWKHFNSHQIKDDSSKFFISFEIEMACQLKCKSYCF